METLRTALLAAALAASSPAAADPVDGWEREIRQASLRFDIPQRWIRRVIRAESGGRASSNGRPIVSRAGAMGLMQLMPGTWLEMRTMLDLGSDPFNPADNILAGTAYLRMMYERFGYPGLFAAYNAGPARYAAYLARARPLPDETRAYVITVAGESSTQSINSRTPSLFVVRPPGSNGVGAIDISAAPALDLFVQLGGHDR